MDRLTLELELPLRWASGVLIAAILALPVSGQDAGRLPAASFDRLSSLTLGAGFKDNVTLTRDHAQESPFWLTGLDVILAKDLASQTALTLTLLGEDRRFFLAQTADHEQSLTAVADIRHSSNEWELGCAVQYLYFDQVFAASEVDLPDTVSIRSKAHLVDVTPSLRRHLGRGYSLEVQTDAGREEYAAPLDDDWQLQPRLLCRKEYGRGSSAEIGYRFRSRCYDTRQPRALDGSAMAGRSLGYEFHTAELAVRHNWDQARYWLSGLNLRSVFRQDNGAGYDDYTRYALSGDMRWRQGGWEVRLEAEWSLYAYSRQPGDDGARRRFAEVQGSCRIEKRLLRGVRAFCLFEHARSMGNLNLDDYRLNVFVAGLEVDL